MLNHTLGKLLTQRNKFQHKQDCDVLVWKEILSSDAHVSDFYNAVSIRRTAAFNEIVHEIDTKLRSLADVLKSTNDRGILDLDLQKGTYDVIELDHQCNFY